MEYAICLGSDYNDSKWRPRPRSSCVDIGQVKDGKKMEHLAVLAVRSDETNNTLDDDESFSHINELQGLQQTLLPDLRQLRDAIKPSNTSRGDIISGLVVAIDMMEKHTRKLKYARKIVLVTDASGPLDPEDNDQIVGKLRDDNIQLTVLGVDFDDAEYGFKEEDKDPIKTENEEILRKLCDDSNGNYGTMAYAISELGLPRLTLPNPTALYKGMLTLGDPDKYDTAMSISVERYAKVRLAKAPTASSFVVKTGGAAHASASTQTSATMQNGSQLALEDELASVKYARTYTVNDEKAPGGKRELERDDLARGYEYGRTAVPMEREDEHVTKLETFASFDIIGFVAASEYEHWMSMSETSQTVASKLNQKSAMAFSSLIHALHERDSYAVARLVTKDGRDPVMVLMAPFFDPDNRFECLIDVELPFAEDMRSFTFPPLDKIVTVGGKHITTHRSLPNEALMNAISDYVDALDLTTFGKDDEGEPAEYAAIPDTYNLRKNYMEQAIKFRAIHPMDEVPPPFDILSKYSTPPDELLISAQPMLDAAIKAADVKKVPPKQKGRKRGRDTEKPLSGLDVESLLRGSQKRVKITPENAIPEFKQMLAGTEEMSGLKDAVKQLGMIVEEYIRTSTGSYNYQRAVEAVRVMKEEMMEYEEPNIFNEFLRGLKKKLVAAELGGDRTEMWYLIKVHRLGLIDSATTELSDVSPEDAKAVSRFLSLNLRDGIILINYSSSCH
jgi:ATP-dependent DNA helicase 2 subunit 2